MKFERRDFGKLQWQLLIALGALAIGLALAYWTSSLSGTARIERNAAASRKAAIEQTLGQVRTEELDIKTRTQQFLEMDASGITGPEKRLDWMEMLRDIQRQLRIPGMTYEFGAQNLIDTNTSGGYAFHGSQVKIQLRLLHEEDLLNFLGRIQREAKALVLVRSCKVARLPPSSQDAAQLSADCVMEWVTLRPSSGGKP